MNKWMLIILPMFLFSSCRKDLSFNETSYDLNEVSGVYEWSFSKKIVDGEVENIESSNSFYKEAIQILEDGMVVLISKGAIIEYYHINKVVKENNTYNITCRNLYSNESLSFSIKDNIVVCKSYPIHEAKNYFYYNE